MGYDVHITRAEEWMDSSSAPISLREWLDYVANDPEMRLDGHADATVGQGEILRYENDGLAVWTKYSGHGADGNMAWFDFSDSHIVVKNPDEEIIDKMCHVAEALDARVQGDDGEFYPTPPSSGAPPAKPSSISTGGPAKESGSWWKRLLGR